MPQRSCVVVLPANTKPLDAPNPLFVVAAQVPNVEVVIRAAVDGAPKEDAAGPAAPTLLLPVIRDEMRMSKQEVQNVGIEDWLASKSPAKHEAVYAAILLCLVDIQLDSGWVPYDGVNAVDRVLKLLNLPTAMRGGVESQIDEMAGIGRRGTECSDHNILRR